MKSWNYHSYAKINVGLRIVNKRPDGYHNLESIFQEIDLADKLTFTKIDAGFEIHTNHPAVPTDERNICSRVFQLMQQKYNLPGGLHLELDKIIPLGGGLGGGSSNAATCIKAINEIFELNLNIPEMIGLAAAVGSDVPFFILGKTALVKGRGEVVIPLQFLRNYKVLLVCPKLHISTPEIFKNFEINLTKYRRDIIFEAVISRVQALTDLKGLFYNDLEGVVFKVYPTEKKIKSALEYIDLEYVSLSGTGAAIYGLTEREVNLTDLRIKVDADYDLYFVDLIV